MPPQSTHQAPKGLRDFYPDDLLRRRYIEKLWRDTSIRHGFDEIDGPTFEHTSLYTVKSGDAIVSEIFSVFSGKDRDELKSLGESLARGESAAAPFALRPEFTPTLARMYAAKAGSLPKPTKWFWMQNCFRAERPQRGRLREFSQWNCDIIGLALPEKPTPDDSAAATARADCESMAVITDVSLDAGLNAHDVRLHYSHRGFAECILRAVGVRADSIDLAVALCDRAKKIDAAPFVAELVSFGPTPESAKRTFDYLRSPFEPASMSERLAIDIPDHSVPPALSVLSHSLTSIGLQPWTIFDPSIARGLAYYTGMVFEVIAEGGGERAVAGGGRYDNLIQLFGGPPTPAVGFGMGDVVLANLLADKNLMPAGKDLLDALSRPAASLRPDIFIIANESTESQAALRPLVARLRRGSENPAWLARGEGGRKPWDADRYAVPPLHARHSYKSTKNIGKLLQEAAASHARFAAIIESADHATLKDLSTASQTPDVPLADLGARVAAALRPSIPTP